MNRIMPIFLGEEEGVVHESVSRFSGSRRKGNDLAQGERRRGFS
jgi:hypothetical protein